MRELTKEEKISRFHTIKDLTVHPAWSMMVEAINEIQENLVHALRSTKFTDLFVVEQIQNEIIHYEKLKNLPDEFMSIYDSYNHLLQSNDPYAQIDQEYEENMKKGPQ